MSDSMVLRAVVREAATPPPAGSGGPTWLRAAGHGLKAAFRRLNGVSEADQFPAAVEATDQDLERLSRWQDPMDAVGQIRVGALMRTGRL